MRIHFIEDSWIVTRLDLLCHARHLLSCAKFVNRRFAATRVLVLRRVLKGRLGCFAASCVVFPTYSVDRFVDRCAGPADPASLPFRPARPSLAPVRWSSPPGCSVPVSDIFSFSRSQGHMPRPASASTRIPSSTTCGEVLPCPAIPPSQPSHAIVVKSL